MTLDPEVGEVLRGERRWWVVDGDCLEVLPALPGKSVDQCLSDPPYGAAMYRNIRTIPGAAPRPHEDVTAIALIEGAIGTIDGLLVPVAAEIARLTKRWVVLFHDAESGHLWRDALGDGIYIRTGAWVKDNPLPQISGDRPGQGFELCVIGHALPRSRMHWNGGGRSAVWRHPSCQGVDRPDHPCPKPLSLMLELVEQFTDENELVCDPFTGSGTTGVACLRLGRRFLGVEKSQKYAALARERLEAESKGLTLRDARHGQLPLLAPVR